MMKISPVLLALMFAIPAVTSANEQPDAPITGTPTSMVLSETSQESKDVQAMTRLLSARHPEDLPSSTFWSARPDAVSALRWVALNGPLTFHRERALSVLRHYPDRANKELLLDHLKEERYHALIRSGAARGLIGQDLQKTDCIAVKNLDTNQSEILQNAVKRLIVERCS